MLLLIAANVANLEVGDMATGGPPFDDSAEGLHSWTAPNCSLEDRLNNMVSTSQNTHLKAGSTNMNAFS